MEAPFMEGVVDNDTLRRVLADVPATRLRLLELAREMVDEDGALCLEEAAARGDEIEQANVQARVYSRATARLRAAVRWRVHRH